MLNKLCFDLLFHLYFFLKFCFEFEKFSLYNSRTSGTTYCSDLHRTSLICRSSSLSATNRSWKSTRSGIARLSTRRRHRQQQRARHDVACVRRARQQSRLCRRRRRRHRQRWQCTCDCCSMPRTRRRRRRRRRRLSLRVTSASQRFSLSTMCRLIIIFQCVLSSFLSFAQCTNQARIDRAAMRDADDVASIAAALTSGGSVSSSSVSSTTTSYWPRVLAAARRVALWRATTLANCDANDDEQVCFCVENTNIN